ncbi:glycosyl-4,4'-diaponeurosporenoate acyltransferase CrtO family protein [Sphingobacterium suaedae]|uniref:Glycosyl-4,4'-diaponeurosporenoate acyltransferase n=1 Tax=Sphingobacterium suaedae TaxID=1686402 RepID=A0ABW5KH33_9SPHI
MKKVLILVAIVALTGICIYALSYYLPLQSFSFAFSLNFMLMAGILLFTDTLAHPLQSPYFNEQRWERHGDVYTSFGINGYRKLLRWTGWEKLNKKSKPVNKTIPSLNYLYYRTKQDELGHLLIFFVVLGFTLFVAFVHGIQAAVWLFSLNIVLNLYPIMLQRYNRPRLARVIRFANRR